MKSKLALVAVVALTLSCGVREDKEDEKPNEQNQYTIINGVCYQNGEKQECSEDKTPEQPKAPEMECGCSCECNGEKVSTSLDGNYETDLINEDLGSVVQNCFTKKPQPPETKPVPPSNGNSSSCSQSSSDGTNTNSNTNNNTNNNSNTNTINISVNGKEVRCENKRNRCSCSCECKEKLPQNIIPI